MRIFLSAWILLLTFGMNPQGFAEDTEKVKSDSNDDSDPTKKKKRGRLGARRLLDSSRRQCQRGIQETLIKRLGRNSETASIDPSEFHKYFEKPALRKHVNAMDDMEITPISYVQMPRYQIFKNPFQVQEKVSNKRNIFTFSLPGEGLGSARESRTVGLRKGPLKARDFLGKSEEERLWSYVESVKAKLKKKFKNVSLYAGSLISASDSKGGRRAWSGIPAEMSPRMKRLKTVQELEEDSMPLMTFMRGEYDEIVVIPGKGAYWRSDLERWERDQHLKTKFIFTIKSEMGSDTKVSGPDRDIRIEAGSGMTLMERVGFSYPPSALPTLNVWMVWEVE